MVDKGEEQEAVESSSVHVEVDDQLPFFRRRDEEQLSVTMLTLNVVPTRVFM